MGLDPEMYHPFRMSTAKLAAGFPRNPPSCSFFLCLASSCTIINHSDAARLKIFIGSDPADNYPRHCRHSPGQGPQHPQPLLPISTPCLHVFPAIGPALRQYTPKFRTPAASCSLLQPFTACHHGNGDDVRAPTPSSARNSTGPGWGTGGTAAGAGGAAGTAGMDGLSSRKPRAVSTAHGYMSIWAPSGSLDVLHSFSTSSILE